ncbi:hypothetical protein [Persicobacter sp. CCB-QB2]|uniref:hypothetical protein n=1 Tax=Persicobacter sp. CCB-QB2 TaxID=1561025 RepID=UPI0012F8347F|nr:hypothetical protein [Persicobacter sp. CCB-QB2]
MMKAIFLLVMFTGVFLSTLLYGQAEQEGQSHPHEAKGSGHVHGRHAINFYTGFTFIPPKHYAHIDVLGLRNTGNWVPTLGLDYVYKINHRWSLGLMADVELDRYTMLTLSEQWIVRENVVVLAAVAKFELLKGFSVFAGPGYEQMFAEGGEDFWLVKVGLEYEIRMEKGWQLAPSIIYDYKDVYQTISYGFAVGKRF